MSGLIADLNMLKKGIEAGDMKLIAEAYESLSGDTVEFVDAPPSSSGVKDMAFDAMVEIIRPFIGDDSDPVGLDEADESEQEEPVVEEPVEAPVAPVASVKKKRGRPKKKKPGKTIGELMNDAGITVPKSGKDGKPRSPKRYPKKVCNECGKEFENKYGGSKCEKCLGGLAGTK